MFISNKVKICLSVVIFLLSSGAVSAQDAVLSQDGVLSQEEAVMLSVQKEMNSLYQDRTIVRPSLPSLLFLPGEHGLLQAAKASFLTRVPTHTELASTADDSEDISSIRYLSLGGILYTGEKSWVIWLNDQRITPDALPTEVMDLSVSKEYINIKWFDRQTNKIFPIRLRPNQTFNLDARMFLPG